MNLIKLKIINLIDIILLNSILSTIKCLKKLIIKINILQQNINFSLNDQCYFRKNIVQIIHDHSTFLIKFINLTDDVVSFVNNLQN